MKNGIHGYELSMRLADLVAFAGAPEILSMLHSCLITQALEANVEKNEVLELCLLRQASIIKVALTRLTKAQMEYDRGAV